MKATLHQVKDRWVVTEVSSDTLEPVETEMSWLVQTCQGPLDDGLSVEYTGDGCWRGYLNGRWTLVYTGGNVPAIQIARRPIPAPKVRPGMELRWHFGRWEKFTKARGWVAA